MSRFRLTALSLSLIVLNTAGYAAPIKSERVVVAPNCLTAQLNTPYQTLAKKTSLSLIAVNRSQIAALSTLRAKHDKLCGGFADVTADWQVSKIDAAAFLAKYTAPVLPPFHHMEYKIQYPTQVQEMMNKLSPNVMWSDLSAFSSFEDRYADSDTGVSAANWLKEKVENIAHENHRTDVSAYFIKTGDDYRQPSLVVKVGNGSGPGIVIGAHLDTVEKSWDGNKPGADDDGSGSMTVLAAARVLLASNMQFKKPIYFIWYAAEEEGLVGSGYVVKEFKAKKIPVDAVLHMDLTGYAHQNKPDMWLIDDNVDKKLTTYLEQLIKTYVKRPVNYTRCGYACSDHANWTRNGYAAAIPAEARFEDTNPDIHSTEDSMDKLSLQHMSDYAKLATAFMVELAEPV